MERQERVECPHCETLIPAADYEEARMQEEPCQCSYCENSLRDGECERVTVYLLQVHQTVASDPTEEGPEEVAEATQTEGCGLASSFLADVFCHAHLLRYYSQDGELRTKSPLAGNRVLMVLHFLRDMLPFFEAAVALGLEPRNAVAFYKPYWYPQRDGVTEWLTARGCEVRHIDQLNGYLAGLNSRNAEDIGQVLVIEDGGYIAALMHDKFARLCGTTIGAVEQTTRGITNMRRWLRSADGRSLSFPIISVAGSSLKAEFEPPYIADAVVRNLKRMLPDVALRGKPAAVLGFGTIGRALAEKLRDEGVLVTVFDARQESMLQAEQDSFTGEESGPAAARGKRFVFGASGQCSVDAEVIAALSHDTYVVSASSDQYEIDMRELEQLKTDSGPVKGQGDGESIGTDYVLPADARRVHVIANGYPINFWGAESMPGEASDLILTLILLCAVDLALGIRYGPGIHEQAVDELAGLERYDVAGGFRRIHQAR